MATFTKQEGRQREVDILARVLGEADGSLSPTVARHFLRLEFGDEDKARMHELAVRNQGDDLSSEEREELFAYVKAGTLLSLLKSRARRVLATRSARRRTS